ncbi:hypothetical protein ACEWY4_000503 [Coilia grayii]|uniref:Cadherin domain-containing protein n=1 Tax=Coilia grayii TaxID=363190 RepID=A0ABD1KWW8_9TELE
MLMANNKVDYEIYRLLKLHFEARNVTGEVDTRLGMEINILDINDNVPMLDRNYNIRVEESTRQGEDVVTVRGDDLDNAKTGNGTFDLKIVSVTPQDDDIDFVLEQQHQAGKITFRGCLNYDKFQKYTVLVEAKDRGDKVQLSSTGTVIINVMDNNNHPPVFTGLTGSGKVKEGESGVTVLRLQVSDKDTQGTPAWRVRYTLHGDPRGHFNITTDPVTNEGVLTVVKPLNYEDSGKYKNLTVTVQNEEPYFTCKVKGRSPTGLWNVEWVGGDGTAPSLISQPISITIEDVNDPPIFFPKVKDIRIMENSPAGTFLETFAAIDKDKTHANSFDFQVGKDPADWVVVNSTTGKVSTKHILDRESKHVNNSIYTVLIWAVDHGKPPMTGTGTLHIFLVDQNDNVPVLDVSDLAMCLSDKPTSTNISAHDLDLPPYSDPFHFELLGDVEGKWKVDPTYGTTVNLVKDKAVYAGHHKLTLRISDSQGQHSLQNISITVCDCTESPSCLKQKMSSSLAASGIGIIFLALLLLLALFLLACLLSCKREKIFIAADDGPEWHLLHSNIEKPGTDCKIPLSGGEQMITKVDTVDQKSTNPVIVKGTGVTSSSQPGNGAFFGSGKWTATQNVESSQFEKEAFFDSRRWVSSTSQAGKSTWKFRNGEGSMMSRNSLFLRQEDLSNQLIKRLGMLESFQEELGHYDPHEYAEEGEPASDPQLDAISVPGQDFDMDLLRDLDPKFKTLASVCRPDLVELS